MADHGLPLRHHQAGESVNAEVQKRRTEGDAGAGENGVGVPAKGEQPGQGLVNEAAAGDDDQVAAGQQQLAGGIRVVPGLGAALQNIDLFGLFPQAGGAAHMAHDAHGLAGKIQAVGIMAIVRQAGKAVRRVIKGIHRRQTEAGLLQIPAFHRLGSLGKGQARKPRRVQGRDAGAGGVHGKAQACLRIGQAPLLPHGGGQNRGGAVDPGKQGVI